MQTIELIRDNLLHGEEIVLAGVEDMRDHCFTFATQNGGAHTLWVLGHLAFIEGQVIHEFMLGEANPLAHWEDPFDVGDVSGDPAHYPPFDEVLAECRSVRAATLALLNGVTEEDLDRPSPGAPKSVEHLFGTHRRCFQFTANHWFMHRGNLADARRSAGLKRSWF